MVRLVVGESAAKVRCELGPTAWAALEELAARSPSEPDDQHLVMASVRDVAEALGISKNAAHRALRRLSDADLVTPVQARAADGRFVAGRYRVAVEADVLQHVPNESTLTIRASSRTGRHITPTCRHAADDPTQLSLLAP